MITAFVLLITKTGKEEVSKTKFKKIQEIKEIHQIYGEYDIILKVELESLTKLDNFVSKLRKDKNIRATSTLITSD